MEDLRPRTDRHWKFTPQLCAYFHNGQVCPWGTRCRDLHQEQLVKMSNGEYMLLGEDQLRSRIVRPSNIRMPRETDRSMFHMKATTTLSYSMPPSPTMPFRAVAMAAPSAAAPTAADASDSPETAGITQETSSSSEPPAQQHDWQASPVMENSQFPARMPLHHHSPLVKFSPQFPTVTTSIELSPSVASSVIQSPMTLYQCSKDRKSVV